MGEKILVVEDSPTALRLVTFALESEGYEVISAVNGLEGLRKARAEAPALVVLDLVLPGIDGGEVCQQLRSDQCSSQARLPILVLSAYPQYAEWLARREDGADRYLPKPATPEEITEAVRSLLDARQDPDG